MLDVHTETQISELAIRKELQATKALKKAHS